MSETIEGYATDVPKQELTIVPVYTQTARDLAELEAELKGLVVNVDTKEGMKEAKAIVRRLVTCRTTLEKVRKEANADLIRQKSINDDEAKRIAAQIVALEEPIKLQIDIKEAEEARILAEKAEIERLRIEQLVGAIQALRDTPASVQGQPAVIIAGALKRVDSTVIEEAEFAEYYQQAIDARDAVIGRLTAMLHDQKAHESEQEQIKRDREELERQREENARLQREADERAEADRLERERLAQVERDRVAAEERAQREAEQVQRNEEARIAREAQEEADRIERERVAAERAEQQAALDAERERQAAEQKKLDEQAAKLKREQQEALAAAEKARLAGLGLREAVERLIIVYYEGENIGQCMEDLKVALANDTDEAKPARAKRAKG